eukprot:ANDGO_03433.mRNA.1 hypothetical protein
MGVPSLGILYGSFAFLALGALMLFATMVCCGKDKSLARTSVVAATVSMWLIWMFIYMAQMYPIVEPEREV